MTGTDCYATLRVPTREVPPPVNSRQRVSIDEYAEVPICDDVAIYSDVRSNVVWPTGRPHWTPHYCGFVSTEPSPPILLTKTEDCACSIDPSYEICVNSRTPKRPRHDRSVWFHSRTTNHANMDNALLMSQRDELQDDITHDGNYADTDDYLHFDDDAIQEKLSTVTVGLRQSNIICDNHPCEMESSYLTCRRTDSIDAPYLEPVDFTRPSYLNASVIRDSAYIRSDSFDCTYITTTDCMDSTVSQLQAPRNTADRVFVTRKETPPALTASDFRPFAGGASISGPGESGSKPVEG